MDHVAYRVAMYADSLHKMSNIARCCVFLEPAKKFNIQIFLQKNLCLRNRLTSCVVRESKQRDLFSGKGIFYRRFALYRFTIFP